MKITPATIVIVYLLAALAFALVGLASCALLGRLARTLSYRRELRRTLTPHWWLAFERDFQIYAREWSRARDAEQRRRRDSHQ